MSLRMALAAFLETDIPSAATVDLGSANTMWVRVTGSTGPITSFGTRHNCWRYVRFGSTPTLVHNLTSLAIPGSANVVCAAGDRLFAKSDTSGNWRVESFTRASGKPLIASAFSDMADYSEENFTPALAFGTPPTGLAYSSQVGRATKIGRLVFVKVGIVLSSKGTGGAGNATITGLPYANGASVASVLSMMGNQITTQSASYTMFVAQMAASASVITLYQQGPGQAVNNLTWSNFADSSYLFVSGCYNV